MNESSKTVGIIDIGTNTFHILIAEILGKQFKTLHKERIYVKLGEGGLHSILEPAFERGIQAFKRFRLILDQFHCKEYLCLGTAAMRSSDNAQAFKEKVWKETRIKIQTITGSEEAKFIFEGVSLAYPLSLEKVLIMDIGGGSVEFIIANEEKIWFSKSYPIGLTILKRKFHQEDPINELSKKEMKAFLSSTLEDLLGHVELHKPELLIGSSGTFEVLDNSSKKGVLLNDQCKEINFNEFLLFSKAIISTESKDLMLHPSIPKSRVDLISVALLLILFTTDLAKISRIVSSKYAMKEGALRQFI